MPLLYYWRDDNYRDDLDRGAAYHLNQGNPALHDIAMPSSGPSRKRLGKRITRAVRSPRSQCPLGPAAGW